MRPFSFVISDSVQTIVSLDTNVFVHHLPIIQLLAQSMLNFFFHGRFVGLELTHLRFDKAKKTDIVYQIEARGLKIDRCREMFERGFAVLYTGRMNPKTGKPYPAKAVDYADEDLYEYNSDFSDFAILVEAIASFREMAVVIKTDMKYVFLTADINLMRIATEINTKPESQAVFEPTFAVEDLTRWSVKAPQNF
jgi:hypothetical protein